MSVVLLGFATLIAPASAQDRDLDPAACSACGQGWTTFFEWRCERFQWTLVEVGHAIWPHCGPREITGDVTDCFETIRQPAHGGRDEGQCNQFVCEAPPDAQCGPWTGTIPFDPPDRFHPGDGDDGDPWWVDVRRSEPPEEVHPGNP